MWSRLPDPPVAGTVPEAARDGRVYTHRGDRVLVLDLAAATWSELPPDDQRPPLRDGRVFATDAGVVLTGVNYGEAAPDEPTLTQLDRWDGTAWQRLPRTGMLGSLEHWTGHRLVGVGIGGADGGEVDGWGRWYPMAGAVDPATGRWSRLSGTPGFEDLAGHWPVEAADGPRLATAGFVYDDELHTWTPLEPPASAQVTQQLAGAWAGDRLVVVGGAGDDGQVRAEVWIGVTAPQPCVRPPAPAP